MVKPGDSKEAEATSASTALERAQAAIKKLEEIGDGQRKVGSVLWLAIVVVILLAVGGLVVHTFFEERAPQIDSTSVALLAVALIAPFVPRLKALEVGGAKAEWRESAESGMKDIVAVFKPQQEAIQQLFDDMASAIASGPQPELKQTEFEGNFGILPRHSSADRSPKPLRRVLWFDEFPGTSENELTTLQKLLPVIVASSRDQAMQSILHDSVDAVVINEMRGDPNLNAPPSGLTKLVADNEVLASKRLPVFVYMSESLAEAYRKQMDGGRATVVTSFSELVRALRLVEGAALEQFARTVAAENGSLVNSQPDQGVDVVVELASGDRVGIEASSWLKTPQMSAFADRVNQLVDGLAAEKFAHGILLTRPDLIDERRRRWASEHQVEVVGPDELQGALLRINGS